MSTTTHRLFISDVASSMLAYKQYLTEDRTTSHGNIVLVYFCGMGQCFVSHA